MATYARMDHPIPMVIHVALKDSVPAECWCICDCEEKLFKVTRNNYMEGNRGIDLAPNFCMHI